MPEVLATREHGALWLRIHRPEHGNALAPSTLGALEDGLSGLAADDRAVVVTGTQGVFCAGADVRAAGDMLDDEDALLAFMDHAGALLTRLESLPVPTLAAVNGLTMAGGLELALACDLIIAADDAPIGDGHTAHGFTPAWGTTARLPRRAGRGAATWLLATGRPVPAARLVACGLVSEVVPAARLEERVRERLGELGGARPIALAESLRLARAATSRGLDEALAAEREAFIRQIGRAELREGVGGFGRPDA
jgi:enoyl-CoA hydratase